MAKYVVKSKMSWEQVSVRGGTIMDRSAIWEGTHNVQSAYHRIPKGMEIPSHTHPKWVQVVVIEGEMEVKTQQDGIQKIQSGECYFVEPGETHIERATKDSLLLVTQDEDRPEFRN